MKIKSHNKIFSLFIASFIFMIFAGVLFFGEINISYAGTCDCFDSTTAAPPQFQAGAELECAQSCVSKGHYNYIFDKGVLNPFPKDARVLLGTADTHYCICTSGLGSEQDREELPGITDQAVCNTKCTENGYDQGYMSPDSIAQIQSNNEHRVASLTEEDRCLSALPSTWIKCPLLGILKLAGWLLNIAFLLFAWVIDANKLNAVLSNQAIYDSWEVVRDLLNIAFILVLLFSAFASIFQASSYNYKKILLWLVIMALLVNFSYPITRFIIDVSNSLMYTILKQAFGANNEPFIMRLAPFNTLKDIITPPDGPKTDLTQIIASIIFVFILALTILAMGLLLLIRTIALAILIIFSPIAFVGSILSKGGEWWDHLFKYAMAGPMMAIVLAVSMNIIKAMGDLSLSGEGYSGAGSATDFVPMAKFIIPITILWVGIGMASKGIAGSSTIVGGVQKFAKVVGKRFSGYNYGKSQYDAFAAKRKARADEIQKGRFGDNIGNQMNKLEDSAIGALHIPILSKDARKRVEKMRQAEKIKDVKDKADDLKGAPIDSLSIEVNNSFDMGTGAVKPNITKGQAGSAQAFMDKQGDDRKTFIEDVLQTKGGTKTPGLAGSGIENLFAGLAATHPTRVAADRVAAGTASADELRRVTSYVNKKSEDIVNQYTK